MRLACFDYKRTYHWKLPSKKLVFKRSEWIVLLPKLIRELEARIRVFDPQIPDLPQNLDVEADNLTRFRALNAQLVDHFKTDGTGLEVGNEQVIQEQKENLIQK